MIRERKRTFGARHTRVTRRQVLRMASAGVAFMATPLRRVLGQSRFELKFGSVEATTDNPLYDADKWFADECTKRSAGALTVRYFPSGQLGGQRDLVEGLKLGTIDIALATTSLVSTYVPDLEVFNLPYMFASKDKLYNFVDSPEGKQHLTEVMEKAGFHNLGFSDAGVRNVYNSRRRVRHVSDLKGLKIRVEENPIRVGTFNAMGAQATPMAFTEVFNALQQGVVDGLENSPTIYVASKFYEVCKFASKTEHFISPNPRLMSRASWDKLPNEFKDLITKVAEEAIRLERRLWAESEATVWARIARLDVTVDEVDKGGFRNAVQHFLEQQIAKLNPAWVDKVRRAAG